MSLYSSAPGVPAKQKVVPIRPAVPLIYERRVRISNARTLSCNSIPEKVINQSVKDDAISIEDDQSMQTPAEEFGSQLADERSPHLHNESKDNVGTYIGETAHNIQETERISEISDVLSSEYREKSRDEAHVKTENVSKVLEDEPLTASMDPPSSIALPSVEMISQTNGTLYPPESYQEAFPDTPGTIVQQQLFPTGWIVPPYDFQVQSQNPHGWIGGYEMNGIGGLPPPTPSTSVDDGSAPIDSKFVDHVLSNFNDDRYADIRLVIRHEKARFATFTFFLHRVLVFRSETLRTILEGSTKTHDGIDTKHEPRISLCDRFITPNALESALRTCYGQTASASLLSKGREMQDILALAAAGHLLKLEDVASQALEKARKILSWENLQDALSFGLESCTHRCGSHEAVLLQPFAYSKADGNSFSVNCARYLLDLSIHFMIVSFPDTWVFDKAAEPLPIVDRLPIRSGMANPQGKKPGLSRIQFGQRPPEADSRLSDRSALLSSILLSLPMQQLQIIISAKIPCLIRQLPHVIVEREHRRLAALNSKIPWDQRRLAKEREWHCVGLQEFLVTNGLDGGEVELLCSPVSIYRTAADERKAENRNLASQSQMPGLDASKS